MFILVTIVTCLVVFFLIVGAVNMVVADDDFFTGAVLLIFAGVVALLFFNVTNNRDTSRDDQATVTGVSHFIDKGPLFYAVQFDGVKLSGVTCTPETKDACERVALGDTVTVHTTYNSVGFEDTQTLIVTPAPQ